MLNKDNVFQPTKLMNGNQFQYGIIAKKSLIKFSSFSFNNNFPGITILERKLNNVEYWVIMFGKNESEEFVESMSTIFNNEFEVKPESTICDILNRISSIFATKKQEDLKNQYLGKMCELAFILKSKRLGFNIFDNYQKGPDKLDFHFKNNKEVEIKFVNKSSKSITISGKQLEVINKNTNNYLLAINCYFDSINGLNLLDLCDEIKPQYHNEFWEKNREDIENIRTLNPDLFDEYKIVIDESDFLFINKEFLPTIQIKSFKTESGADDTALISSSFKLFVCSTTTNSNFEEILMDIVNG